MRKTGFIFIFLAFILFLIGFIPDKTEKVQFHYSGEEIIQRIESDHSDLSIFTGRESAKQFIQNHNLEIYAQIPVSILAGRQGHVEMTARMFEREGSSPAENIQQGYKLQIKSHLDFPRQFVEPNGYNSKPISTQASPVFFWNIFTDKPENLTGKLWIYMVIQNPQGVTIEYPLLARDIEIKATTLVGMKLATSRIAGLSSGLIGVGILLFYKLMTKSKARKKSDMIK